MAAAGGGGADADRRDRSDVAVVGLVLVSHSAALAESVAALAAEMAGPDTRIGVAGGLAEPADALGTDAARVLRALDDAWSEDGVLVLMDLGSAVLSAELAVDLLDEERRGRVLLTEAPLVEGAVAAAVAAGLGEPLEEVAAAARSGLAGKAAHLSVEATGVAGAAGPAADAGEAQQTLRITIRNRLGLHARPAALLVRTAGGFDAHISVSHETSGRGPVSARSLSGVATLGARRGDELVVTASGPQAEEAIAAIRRLAAEGFGEPEDLGPEGPGPVTGGPVDLGPDAVAVDEAADRRSTSATPPTAGAVITGIPASPGVAAGPARRLGSGAARLADVPAEQPDDEWAALTAARAATAADVRRMRTSVAGRAHAQDAAIFDAHLLLLDDEALLAPAREGVFGRGETAARAWHAAVAAVADDWRSLDDPYQRARAADLLSVGDQVLGHLPAARAGVAAGPSAADAPGPAGPGGASSPGPGGIEATEPGVVIAPDLSPAQVAALDRSATAAIVCASGGPTSHAAILARALGLPTVVGAGDGLLAVADGTPLAVDGDAGTVTVEPAPDALAAVERRRRADAREAAEAHAAAGRPAVTRDGATVPVEANVAETADADAAIAAGADGVGLLRTEFLFLDAAEMPDEDEQAAAYAAVAAALHGRPLTIRTLDAGADKPLPYLPMPSEANPFLGVRGLRLGLARPEQLLCQLRAVLRVAATHPVRVMVPMVATVEEVRRTRELVAEARASLVARGVAVSARLEVGIMLEIPSAALLAEKLAPYVDFFSVGTNDLTQYALAAERGNAGVATLADPLHPAVLRLIDMTARAAADAGRVVTVCGEVAGDRLAVPLLLGLGVRELSVNAVAVPAVKQAVRATHAAEARRLAAEALDQESAAAVRALLAASPPDDAVREEAHG